MSEKNFKDTLNLPQTEFAMRANLPQREPAWVERWLQEDIYGQLRAKRKAEGAEMFILHLGPPYANGEFHAGHVLSYTLKDMVVRSKFMAGFDAPYLPGWDCHGLPIEWKVEQELRAAGKTKDDLSVKELRDMCRATAEKWIGVQMAGWKRLGVLADWDNHYRTMNKANEAEMVRQLGKLATGGYVYRGHKPVMWSSVEETALAEAEIEYDDNHESLAVYVAYPVQGRDNEHVVIWTTTPWTLPASLAVVYGEELDYVGLKPTQLHAKAAASSDAIYWVAKDLAADFAKMTGMEVVAEAATAKGADFAGVVLSHPFYARDVPMFAADHVTVDQGTGFVHTAPAHGAEDNTVGVQHGLDTECHVDGKGNYDETVADLPQTGVPLTGRNVLDKKTQQDIIAEAVAQGNLLRWYKFKHKYPISWRSKAPLIFRTTPQWFVAMDNDQNLRENALKAIDAVEWIPGYGRNRIYSMIENRPDWCISRQRVWGVPITFFINKNTGEPVFDEAVFEHIAGKVAEHSIDAWELLSTEELLPAGWLEANNLSADDLVKETDILDVWFDSGTTHAHVLRANAELNRPGKRPADIYFEGSDQHRGWFHSSLLTSVANYGEAPYHQVVTHGYIVDGDGRKMSKSLGNGIMASDLADGYGMDIGRLSVAASDYSEDVRLSEEILKNTSDAYRKFRNTFRYLLGNLHGFDAAQAVPVEQMPALEQHILARLGELTQSVQNNYNSYLFHKVYRELYEFCTTELSNRYFDIRKDALYCDAPSSVRRRAVQTVLSELFNTLATHLAPAIPFTTDEAWRERYGAEACVHLETFSVPTKVSAADLSVAFEIRDQVNQKLEELRAAKQLGHPYEASVTVGVKADEQVPAAEILAEICVVSAVEVTAWDGAGERPVEVSKHAGEKCPRCWTYHAELTAEGVCARCEEALTEMGSEAAA